VPQLEQTVFTVLHNCTTSNPLTEVTTSAFCEPKLTPAQGLVGNPDPAGEAAPLMFKVLLQLGLNDVGQFAHN
jgi:hypothetical protein